MRRVSHEIFHIFSPDVLGLIFVSYSYRNFYDRLRRQRVYPSEFIYLRALVEASAPLHRHRLAARFWFPIWPCLEKPREMETQSRQQHR